MRNLFFLGSIAVLAACGSNSTGTNVTCGTGTTLVGDSCEATAGGGDTCGTGTHLDGTMCVPDGPAAAGAPTIAMMDPTDAGISGQTLFTITGTNFAGSDVSDLHVYFGATTTDCEAVVGAATPTTIAGEVPSACDLNVVVTVQTNKGMATTPFHYDAILAADGDAGGVMGQEGDLYLIDPFNQVFVDVGQVMDEFGDVYGVNGFAFSGDQLYAVSSGDSADGDFLDGASSLIAVDITGTNPMWIGETKDADENPFIVTDIKFSGTTLYGLAYAGDPVTSLPADLTQFVVTIDPTTGVVTKVGSSQPGQTETYNAGGLAIDSTGVLYAAATANGSLDTLNTTTAAHTSLVTLDYMFGDAPINSMAYFGDVLLAVVDNGAYGAEPAVNDTVNWSGQTLVVIDPASTMSIISPAFEMPNRSSYKAMVHAIVVPPADFTIGTGRLRHAHWTPLHTSGDATAARAKLQLAHHRAGANLAH